VNTRYVLRRCGAALLSLIFVLALNFVLFRLVKSDPVGSLFRGRNVSQEAKDRLRSEFGLDKSMPQQFVDYVKQTAQGNLGISYSTRQPVADEIAGKIWPTVLLVGSATILSAVIGVFAGIRGAWRRNSGFDRSSTGVSMFTYAIPDFYLGILLLAFFSFWLAWLPTGGMNTPGGSGLVDTGKHLILPCAALAISYFGEYTIIMRSSLLEVLGEDYLVTARAKGLRDALVRKRHAVPNAILPVITLFALNLGFILSGAIAVETVFSWPGLGQATQDALKGPDYPMLQGLFLLFSAAIILTNLVTDLVYGYLDPRVSTP
jgi:peptide/nickel transport system permease protein